MYELILTEKFSKQFNKLPKEIQKRIHTSLERSRIRPHAFVKKLVGNPYFRLRVGDYRVIVNINDNKLQILALEVSHRKNIYK